MKLVSSGKFQATALAFDGNIISYIFGFTLHLVYAFSHDYEFSALGLGSIIGLLQVLGMCCMLIALTTGPGGAVQAMVNLQTVWQTLFDALFLG